MWFGGYCVLRSEWDPGAIVIGIFLMLIGAFLLLLTLALALKFTRHAQAVWSIALAFTALVALGVGGNVLLHPDKALDLSSHPVALGVALLAGGVFLTAWSLVLAFPQRGAALAAAVCGVAFTGAAAAGAFIAAGWLWRHGREAPRLAWHLFMWQIPWGDARPPLGPMVLLSALLLIGDEWRKRRRRRKVGSAPPGP